MSWMSVAAVMELPENDGGVMCEARSPALGSGYTWTWASVLGQLLAEAEARFGPRDHRWTILGVEFSRTEGAPSIWYPGSRGQIAIQLTSDARRNAAQGIFQLAHEVVHLLAPIGRTGALVIEEGTATMFSRDVVPAVGLTVASYAEAERQVRELEQVRPGAIKAARAIEPRFNAFTPELILSVAPEVPASLATSLCTPFDRDATSLGTPPAAL